MRRSGRTTIMIGKLATAVIAALAVTASAAAAGTLDHIAQDKSIRIAFRDDACRNKIGKGGKNAMGCIPALRVLVEPFLLYIRGLAHMPPADLIEMVEQFGRILVYPCWSAPLRSSPSTHSPQQTDTQRSATPNRLHVIAHDDRDLDRGAEPVGYAR
jgi:hypothetical protein